MTNEYEESINMASSPMCGSVALVTGGGGGMGSRIAAALAERGGRVAVLDVDEARAKEVAKGIGGIGIHADLTEPAQVDEAYRAIEAELGPVDVLVNNAGWDKIGPFVDSEPAVWDRLIALNLRAPIQLTQLALRGMLSRHQGRLIFVSSDAARVGSTGEAVYSACKGGVISFAKTVAREAARAGITSNTVCPGPTDTPLLAEVAGDSPKLIESLKRAIPLGRLGTADDIAAMVAFLASEEAGFVTGQTISVSGGLTMS